MFKAKLTASRVLDKVGVLKRAPQGKFIRVINYHSVKDFKNFERQLAYYHKHYSSVNLQELAEFLKGKWSKTKPGLIISFDDGLKTHYKAAHMVEKCGFVGWFFVPAGLIDTNGHMSKKQLKQLDYRHVIGSHTMTHKRLCARVTKEELKEEVIHSKKFLEKILGHRVTTFCWVGGEIKTYGVAAAKIIKKAGYEFVFQTSSAKVTPNTEKILIQRTNVESHWPLSLVKMQLSGLLDVLYYPKRKIVENKTR